MLSEDLLFNYRSIGTYDSYSCQVDDETTEKEVSFYVDLGPSFERRGDAFPVYQVPKDKMVLLSDWSFNIGPIVCPELSVGGSLGRITNSSVYTYVLNCAVFAGEMKIFSPSRSIRYLPSDWIAACFHQLGKQMDVRARATFRFIEVPAPKKPLKVETYGWEAKDKGDIFKGQK